MQPSLLNSLCARRTEIHGRWDALLRVERINSPLALPDALGHLIAPTLDEIFELLAGPPPPMPPPYDCTCGRNPYLAYFGAGEQAMNEALVLSQAALPKVVPAERDEALAGLRHVLATVARREIGLICGVCQFRLLALAN